MARENKTKYAILGVLVGEPQSGYDVRKFLTQAGGFWEESNGQIYPMLQRLLGEGLVEKSVVWQEGKPNRHVYTITEVGREALRAWLLVDVKPGRTRNELLLKLFFGAEVPIEANMRHVEQYKAGLEQNLAEYGAITATLASLPASLEKAYWLMTLRHGQAFARGLVDWCEETLAQLQSMAEVFVDE